MSNQFKIFMVQKQKLKSERGRLNEGLKDMFMTMEPELFRCAVKSLAKLRDTNKPGFNQVLVLFEEFKNNEQAKNCVGNVIDKRFKKLDNNLKELLKTLFSSYWYSQRYYVGGYFWRMMPMKKENESEAQFDIRCKRMEDNLMQVMLDVLDDCDYYIKGTQNSQK